MKLKELNLNIPHYLIAIGESSGRLLVTKTMRSEIRRSIYITYSDRFFIYPQIEKNSYVGIPIISLEADPEETIYKGVNYVKFNLHYKYEHNYIAYDIAAVAQIIKQYLKKKYEKKKNDNKDLNVIKVTKWKPMYQIQQEYKIIMKQLKQLN